MKFRTGVFLVAISVTACTAASNQPLAGHQALRATSSETTVPEGQVQKAEEAPAESRSSFLQYSSRDVPGHASKCIVGASVDEDGMNQKPVARLAEPDGQIRWEARLPIPADYFQGRAAHCVASSKDLYVLLQYDTQPAQALSQSQLRIARLSLDSGKVQKTVDVIVPGATTAYSAWVSDAPIDFTLEAGKLSVTGEFFLMSDESEHRTFKAIVDTRSVE